MQMFHRWIVGGKEVGIAVHHQIRYDDDGTTDVELRPLKVDVEEESLFRPFQIIWRPDQPNRAYRSTSAMIVLDGPNGSIVLLLLLWML
jgi:hypothetical protein